MNIYIYIYAHAVMADSFAYIDERYMSTSIYIYGYIFINIYIYIYIYAHAVMANSFACIDERYMSTSIYIYMAIYV